MRQTGILPRYRATNRRTKSPYRRNLWGNKKDPTESRGGLPFRRFLGRRNKGVRKHIDKIHKMGVQTTPPSPSNIAPLDGAFLRPSDKRL